MNDFTRLGSMNTGFNMPGMEQSYSFMDPSFGGGIPGMDMDSGTSKGWLGIEGLGKNFDTLKLGLGGLQSLGNLYAAFQANKLAKQQFNFSRDYARANINNQTQSYNTGIADRARSRASIEGPSFNAQSYIDTNSLKRFGS